MSSVFEKDFIQRLIKQIAQLLARALNLTREGKHDEAIVELEAACGGLLGIEYGPLGMVDSQSAAALLRDPIKVKTFARLVHEMARVYADRGDQARERSKKQHALELYVEAAKLRKGDAEVEEAIRALRQEVPADLLPERYREA